MVSFAPAPGFVVTNAKLNVRRDKPSTAAPIARKVGAGVSLPVLGTLVGDKVNGNEQWYAGHGDTFFWAGGCGPFVSAAAQQIQAHRRANGTIEPLSTAETKSVFGAFQFTEAPGGAVRILGDWVADNIVDLQAPALANTSFGTIRVHRKARDSFARVFDAIQADDLQDRIRTCAGTFVPRHKGWNPARSLSSHSWGIAIDLNVQWNGYGVVPAAIGEVGSLRELVPYFEREGFAWGGHFNSALDGMHFELARLDL